MQEMQQSYLPRQISTELVGGASLKADFGKIVQLQIKELPVVGGSICSLRFLGCSAERFLDMKYEEIKIQIEGSAEDSRLETYILDTPLDKNLKIEKRPMVLICPGGAYEKTSFREGEPLAVHFLNQGYHAAVLRYSVAPHQFPTQVLELGKAVRMICEHADEWKVDKELIFIHGASAGGHLAASYGVFWNQEFYDFRFTDNCGCVKGERVIVKLSGHHL